MDITQEQLIPIEIYTDGSLKTNLGRDLTFGAWAFIIIKDGKIEHQMADSVINTTNQRMELLAIVNALKYIDPIRLPTERVKVYSDSAYFINCYREAWYKKWMYNGWMTSKNTSVLHIDLWEQIIPFFNHNWYYFDKVPAHAGNLWNNYCDNLVQQTAQYAKTHWRGYNDKRNL